MGLPADIKSVYAEIGQQIVILRDAGNITGEYMDSEVSAGAPHVRTANFAADTAVVPGDIIQLVPTNEKYLVIANVPDIFANEVIEYEAALYKLNVSGVVYRHGEVAPSAANNYRGGVGWTVLKSGVDALIVPALADVQEAPIGRIALTEYEMYLPAAVGIEPNDRFQVTATSEKFQADEIKKHAYVNVDVARISKDVRE